VPNRRTHAANSLSLKPIRIEAHLEKLASFRRNRGERCSSVVGRMPPCGAPPCSGALTRRSRSAAKTRPYRAQVAKAAPSCLAGKAP